MKSGMVYWLSLTLVGCCFHAGWVLAEAGDSRRIVSLDYCADQFVLKLVEPERIAAVSRDATRDFSYMRDAAEAHRKIRPSAEHVLALAPDLIVRSYGGGPNAVQFYERLDIRVIQIGYASTINEVRAEILRIAEQLGEPEKAREIVADMDARLQRVKARASGKSLLYVTPGGVTSGAGSLVHDMIKAAGLVNFQTEPGWRSLPLEKLAFDQPELLATAFYDTETNHTNYWSAARHPMIRSQLSSTKSVSLDGATTACGGWFLVDAVEQLSEGAAQ
ncbi:MAG: iron complex transport system substrate-binding protein [Candidatus Azotimanducaceae bacterium]|jgi:iron complex transport system substrate-binding protein